jgi:Leucine-rich repeat (LRR) protein
MNCIKLIKVDAFKDFPQLKKINLSDNRIEQIEPGAFGALPKLEELDLHGDALDY